MSSGQKIAAPAEGGATVGIRLGGSDVSLARRSGAAAALERRMRLARHRGHAYQGAVGSGRTGHFWLKRTIDIIVALFGAAFYLPIIALAVLAVQLVDPGPVLYVQERRGYHGRPIRMWKLRTMYTDAATRLTQHLAADPAAREEWRRRFKLRKDPRILPWIGAFLRRSSVDELPQVWNLIRGDMTLVGPRPLPDYHLEAFDWDFRRLRQSVVPGLTGLWQVTARSDGDNAMMRHSDTHYVTHWSIALDLQILLRTIAAVLSGRGAR
jgi:lipopolysaccharide/colanic/teichoic acid biosynthesis glycosyltransferase